MLTKRRFLQWVGTLAAMAVVKPIAGLAGKFRKPTIVNITIHTMEGGSPITHVMPFMRNYQWPDEWHDWDHDIIHSDSLRAQTEKAAFRVIDGLRAA